MSQQSTLKSGIASQNALKIAQDICTEGITLTAQGLRDEALLKYNAVIAQFGLRRKIEFTQVLTTAMYNKGVVLGTLERSEEAIAAYDVLINRFAKSTELVLALSVARAMRNKAYRLNALGQSDKSIATYEAMIAQFGKSVEPQIEAAVAPVKAFLAERQVVLDTREQATRA